MAQSRGLNTKAVTASTTQSQAGAATRLLDGDVNILTVGNASDAVGIPPNLPAGTVFYIMGAATNAATIYPPTGGTINAKSANASEVVAAALLTVVVVLTQTGSASTYAVNKSVAPS